MEYKTIRQQFFEKLSNTEKEYNYLDYVTYQKMILVLDDYVAKIEIPKLREKILKSKKMTKYSLNRRVPEIDNGSEALRKLQNIIKKLGI